jgi:hypothetical protein
MGNRRKGFEAELADFAASSSLRHFHSNAQRGNGALGGGPDGVSGCSVSRAGAGAVLWCRWVMVSGFCSVPGD